MPEEKNMIVISVYVLDIGCLVHDLVLSYNK